MFRSPAPSRRRKKKVIPETELERRLRRYEELLNGYGAKVDLGGVGRSGRMEVDSEEYVRMDPAMGQFVRATETSGVNERSPPAVATPSGGERGRLVVQQGMSKFLDK